MVGFRSIPSGALPKSPTVSFSGVGIANAARLKYCAVNGSGLDGFGSTRTPALIGCPVKLQRAVMPLVKLGRLYATPRVVAFEHVGLTAVPLSSLVTPETCQSRTAALRMGFRFSAKFGIR